MEVGVLGLLGVPAFVELTNFEHVIAQTQHLCMEDSIVKDIQQNKETVVHFVIQVNESVGLSPGNMSIKLELESLKLKRKRLKEMKLAKNSGLEIREGKTYESEIGMTEQNVDEIEIPGPPEIRELTDNILTAPNLIFELETTGLQRTSDIIQIAAYSQNNKFSSYIMLNRAISNGASEVTKISVIGSQMYYNLQAVPSKLQNEAFTDFNDFVKSFLVKPLLVGHNIKRYDCHVLYNSLRFHNMWNDFASNISGFLDTLELFKLLYPKRPSYSQTALVGELLGETYSAHNAVDDTEPLYRLQIIPNNSVINKTTFKLSPMPFFKAISRTLALKAARSNLRLEHFNIAVKRNGLDGLESVLSEQTNQGIVRVTTNKKAIIKIFDFLTRES
ncbi:unnamed protein product [Mytilus edulis]|uniref:Exonuclease domain-containing protein n=1 Tax=Mytilus edulis TaxID=6550 RepID=A0A8S3SC44_MYTED|nr:unnamed protein product [Mytilus edulis]